MIDLIRKNRTQLNAICKKHAVAQLYAFGSAVSGNFRPESDLDLAVLFKEDLSPIAHGDAFFGLKDDLEDLFHITVDIISYRVIKNSVFKEELDRTKVSLYAA